MKQQESQTVEFKESWRDEYLKTVCAFANTDGGTFYIGVNDKGEVIGVDKVKKLMDDLPNKVMNSFGIFIGIHVAEENGLSYIQMNIPKNSTPVAYHGKFYVRCGSTTQELKGSQLQQLILKSNNMTWDEVLVPDARWENIDTETVRLFVRRAIQHNRLPEDVNETNVKELFERLNLSNQGVLTRAAVLLFSKRPTDFNLLAVCKVGRFRGTSNTDLITDDIVECPLFRMPDRIMELLLGKYLNRNFTYSGLQRIETLEYPEIALREAILNALIHRDYAGNSFFYIKVFDKSMELWNEGMLMNPLNIDSLRTQHLSRLRNKIMADIFYRSGQIESWGRGTLKMIENAREGGYAEPIFAEFQDGILVTFEKKEFGDTTNNADDTVNDTVNDTVKTIDELILTQLAIEDGISAPEIAKRIGRPLPTVKRYLGQMKKKGRIEFIGASKTGGYYIKK